jgi:hypothetical protein
MPFSYFNYLNNNKLSKIIIINTQDKLKIEEKEIKNIIKYMIYEDEGLIETYSFLWKDKKRRNNEISFQ